MPSPERLTTEQQESLSQEQDVVDLMIRIYCDGMGHAHESGSLCSSCGALREYTAERNRQCPFLQNKTKTFCQFCTSHCYSPENRRAIIEVMRYAGPRMLWHRPVYAIKHLVEVRKHRHTC